MRDYQQTPAEILDLVKATLLEDADVAPDELEIGEWLYEIRRSLDNAAKGSGTVASPDTFRAQVELMKLVPYAIATVEVFNEVVDEAVPSIELTMEYFGLNNRHCVQDLISALMGEID